MHQLRDTPPPVHAFSFIAKIDSSKPNSNINEKLSNIVFYYFHSKVTPVIVNSLIYFSNIKIIENLIFL
ncbi:hypothetical protein LEP1GSC035_1343 [Leptospira noguchii str. 2007001578]|uniref:Uncharacterized protein n=1 Tax=Leptospira noguchii str. 2007001578 TaxID=1049974 RepID=A0ABN0IVZ7_9LEPT|nr:hypothetical protein LEP1GSC035_1343 [Leptospira noguchii str. 2007001578]